MMPTKPRRARAACGVLAAITCTLHTLTVRADDAPASVTPAKDAPTKDTGATEVRVRGGTSDARKRQNSAEAVQVVDLAQARRETADLGEVMARTQGVSVRRSGGLGSGARFSLNGLSQDQIRFFLDGVPLDFAGYALGVANVPVNLVERVEVYRGVVPIRYGADALGGAVDLVTEAPGSNAARPNGLGVSYQLGSFGTHRATLSGHVKHAPTGFVARASGFFDVTRNDYRVVAPVYDAQGRLGQDVVRRFHDGYLARGGALELGFVDRPWARRLLVRVFASDYDKDLQSDVAMRTAYGEARFSEATRGVTARYERPLGATFTFAALAGYAYRAVDFVDVSPWVYDWYGGRRPRPNTRGEIANLPFDQTVRQHATLGRATLAWTPPASPSEALAHAVRLALSPAYATRTGEERIPRGDPATPEPDPLRARRELFTLVTGIEYELSALPSRAAGSGGGASRRPGPRVLENMVFAKDYVYRASGTESRPTGELVDRALDRHALGVGDALRVRFTPWLSAKASYEFARRLPRADEVFGNGVLVTSNLGIAPETSHNLNLGPRLEIRQTPAGAFTLDVNGFLRLSDALIVLLSNPQFLRYENVARARSAGVEGALGWSSPGGFVRLDGTVTYQDVRNLSREGAFAPFHGQRIPNTPWLFASFGARGRIPHMPGPNDVVEPFYAGRYVHDFYRAWEGAGARATKQTIDAQLSHDVGVSWSVDRDLARLTTTFEIQNLTGATIYDLFGAQRPGRAAYLKFSGTL